MAQLLPYLVCIVASNFLTARSCPLEYLLHHVLLGSHGCFLIRTSSQPSTCDAITSDHSHCILPHPEDDHNSTTNKTNYRQEQINSVANGRCTWCHGCCVIRAICRFLRDSIKSPTDRYMHFNLTSFPGKWPLRRTTTIWEVLVHDAMVHCVMQCVAGIAGRNIDYIHKLLKLLKLLQLNIL